MLLREAGLLVAFALLLSTHFALWPAFLPPGVPALVVVVLGGWCAFDARREVLRLLRAVPASAWGCAALSVLYRLPALLNPWGWVNRDGAYGAFAALSLLQG